MEVYIDYLKGLIFQNCFRTFESKFEVKTRNEIKENQRKVLV